MKLICNLFILSFLCISISSCSTLGQASQQYLSSGNWNYHTREKLLEVINLGKDQNLPVVFDFDNTIICRDIGEATLEVLTQTELHSPFDIIKHYENLLDATKHQESDSSPYANAYAWAVQVMKGLTPFKVIQATKQAYNNESALKDHLDLRGDSKVKHFRRPYFYPEMIDLIGAFIENKYDVYIVSASNIWSVRWMASQLNQKLKQSGFEGEIDLKNVIGVSTLLKNEQ
ncbi:MAG: haloacid dehalogenase-like hydrolase, partial [Bdellovibrionales bacterium]|nr:haloacid dehalogenase-like hydrolase [Bdellovibrionales bacterium]